MHSRAGNRVPHAALPPFAVSAQHLSPVLLTEGENGIAFSSSQEMEERIVVQKVVLNCISKLCRSRVVIINVSH